MIKQSNGFSLIEMAVAVFVIALLLGSILIPLTTQVEQRQISDTQKTLDEIRDALVGFALTNGYLPCPDTNNDGAENVNTGTGQCSTIASGIATGTLPWSTLGVAAVDVWGNRFRYVLNERYARRVPATPFTISASLGTYVRVCSLQACALAANVLTSSAVAAVISHGKNGLGAINNAGVQNPTTGISADENENVDTDRDVVSRVVSGAGAAAGEFDDIVTWLSLYTLLNRMVAAGKLP